MHLHLRWEEIQPEYYGQFLKIRLWWLGLGPARSTCRYGTCCQSRRSSSPHAYQRCDKAHVPRHQSTSIRQGSVCSIPHVSEYTVRIVRAAVHGRVAPCMGVSCCSLFKGAHGSLGSRGRSYVRVGEHNRCTIPHRKLREMKRMHTLQQPKRRDHSCGTTVPLTFSHSKVTCGTMLLFTHYIP